MMHEHPIALVTGAGSGIGLACARMLADDGYGLVLVGRREEPLRAAAAELTSHTPTAACLVHTADIGDLAKAAGCVDAALDRFGRLDVLINNAGLAPMMPIENATSAQIEAIFHVNAMGPVAIIARAWPALGRIGGCVVNISSYATVDPFPGLGVYGSAKAALNVLALACHIEGHARGIRAFSIAPGAVETEMLRSIVPESSLPRDRTLSPEVVAGVVMECVRGARDTQSGQTILLPSP